MQDRIIKIRFLIIIFIFSLRISNASAAEKIAYSHLTEGYWQIWTMDPDGSDKRQITSSKEDKRTPSFLADGQRIGYRTSNGKLYLTDLKTNETKSILDQYSIINNPSFSSVKDEVVFVRFDPVAIDIAHVWLSDFDAQHSRILTQDTVFSAQPKISSAGDKIIFARHGDTKRMTHIWMMDKDGSNKAQLTDGNVFDGAPEFSADQTQAVFHSNRKGEDFDIYQLDLKTKEIEPLTDNDVSDTDPVYSKNGKFIIYVSNKNGSRQIWKLNSKTKEEVSLTDDTESIDPAWGMTR